MKNLIVLRFFVFSLLAICFFFFLTGKAWAISEQYFSNNTFNVYDSDPFSNSSAFFLGKAEEVVWPGPTSYPGILTQSKWIWAPGIANSTTSVDLTQYYFSKKIKVSNYNFVSSGKITIVVDDLAEIYVNGLYVGSHGSISNVEQSGNVPKVFDFTSFLKPGDNVITIRVQNGPSSFSGANCSSCTWQQNPAGTIFSIEINSNDVQLPVPEIKQTSNPWQGQIYDNANKWAPKNSSINSWGCALTSATMILKYYGINKLPNGITLNPGTLNIWLKNQKDGYIGTGWVNWLALSRLSKLAKSINNITAFDALQYSRTNNENKVKLITDISNLLPDILEVPGHFIVAKGLDGTTFSINDPYYNKTTLNDYSNSFLTLGTYTPSFTDLSYIMITTDPEINITLKNSNRNTIGESYIQQSIVNDNNSTQKNSPIKIFYLQTPNKGTYSLEINSGNRKKYNLNVYFYDIGGETKIVNIKGELSKNKFDDFILTFDKNKLKNNKIKHKIKENEFKNEENEIEDPFKSFFL